PARHARCCGGCGAGTSVVLTLAYPHPAYAVGQFRHRQPPGLAGKLRVAEDPLGPLFSCSCNLGRGGQRISRLSTPDFPGPSPLPREANQPLTAALNVPAPAITTCDQAPWGKLLGMPATKIAVRLQTTARARLVPAGRRRSPRPVQGSRWPRWW